MGEPRTLGPDPGTGLDRLELRPGVDPTDGFRQALRRHGHRVQIRLPRAAPAGGLVVPAPLGDGEDEILQPGSRVLVVQVLDRQTLEVGFPHHVHLGGIGPLSSSSDKYHAFDHSSVRWGGITVRSPPVRHEIAGTYFGPPVMSLGPRPILCSAARLCGTGVRSLRQSRCHRPLRVAAAAAMRPMRSPPARDARGHLAPAKRSAAKGERS